LSNYDLLLFDLDGTLSDPLEGISRSINYALEYFGYLKREKTELAAYIGPPLDQTFRVLTGVSDKIRLLELVSKYRERYLEVGYAENVLYPNIKETLSQLYEVGMPMAVCTSKREDQARKILNLFELQDYFLFVSGGDIGIHKWQQMELLLAEDKITESSLMIGDRSVDLIAAHKNGLAGAGVLWGYGSEAELVAERPEHLFKNPSDWLSLLK
jgi:phosphoglycolate phosphatase